MVTGGLFHFIADKPGVPGAGDGNINWSLGGHRPGEKVERTIFQAYHTYARASDTKTRFPHGRPDAPAEWESEVRGDELIVTSRTQLEWPHNPAHTFGHDRTWRFELAPKPAWADSPEHASVDTAIGLTLVWRGRPLPAWLNHLLVWMLLPIVRWRWKGRDPFR